MSNSAQQIIGLVHETLADVTAERLKPIIYRNLETYPKTQSKTLLQWWQAGNTGNDGGANSKPHGTYLWIPALPELVTILPAAAFDNFLYVMTLPLPETLPSNFVLSFDNYSVTPDTAANCQALECQNELRDGLNVYNMGVQVDQQSRSMRIFNHVKSDWFTPDVKIPYPDISKPLSLKAEFRIDRQAGTTTHKSLWLNGVRYEIGVTQPATPQAGAIEMSTAFQIDPNGTGTVMAEIGNMTFACLSA